MTLLSFKTKWRNSSDITMWRQGYAFCARSVQLLRCEVTDHIQPTISNRKQNREGTGEGTHLANPSYPIFGH